MSALHMQKPVSYEPARLHDLRFRKVIGAAGWAALPPAIKQRFSKHISGRKAAVYVGDIVECRVNLAGRLLAQAARIAGAPLPLTFDCDVPAVVTVTEDEASGGQLWTRQYGRHNGFPQVIHSAKRFAGPTGLEEYLGRGFGMALTCDVDAAGLNFRSAYYFVQILSRRFKLPKWLSPGNLTITHADIGHGAFAFILDLRHPWFGQLFYQVGYFRDDVR